MPTLRLRHLWLVALTSLCLVVLCAVTALSLLRQQATLATTLKENVASRRAANPLRVVKTLNAAYSNKNETAIGVVSSCPFDISVQNSASIRFVR